MVTYNLRISGGPNRLSFEYGGFRITQAEMTDILNGVDNITIYKTNTKDCDTILIPDASGSASPSAKKATAKGAKEMHFEEFLDTLSDKQTSQFERGVARIIHEKESKTKSKSKPKSKTKSKSKSKSKTESESESDDDDDDDDDRKKNVEKKKKKNEKIKVTKSTKSSPSVGSVKKGRPDSKPKNGSVKKNSVKKVGSVKKGSVKKNSVKKGSIKKAKK